MWDKILQESHMLIGILISILLGFIIGFERKLRRKEASIGTHTIVCIGSALLVVVSKFGFDASADSARVAAQIVSGIGFLGAGIIVYRQHEIHGLTTAAGLWATAGIGMACGAELYFVAICTTILIVAVRCLYFLPVKLFRHKRFYRLYIEFSQNDNEAAEIKKMFDVEHFHKFEIKRDEKGVYCSVTIDSANEFVSEKLTEIMKNFTFIRSIRREDD